MARQLNIGRNGGGKEPEISGFSPATPDPRLVALVKFLARRAAERDYKEIQSKSAIQATTPQANTVGDVGADS